MFNSQSLSDLAVEYSAALPGFDADEFLTQAIPGLESRELMARLDWIADCIQAQLDVDFPAMADQLEAALPPHLDPTLSDDDFGRFIHAVPGILAVRHGLEEHRERALNLLYAATKRFSMEFYIRPFLNRWPDETFDRLKTWASDENYHVRRLVSEGTRPKLPWARRIDIDTTRPLDLLDLLHADQTRYVTRSVANHLNDISKTDPEAVLERLEHWRGQARQNKAELAWMERHALRTLIKQGHTETLAFLGYRNDLQFDVALKLQSPSVMISEVLDFTCEINCPEAVPVLVDYVMYFHRPDGVDRRKVFKLKQAHCDGRRTLTLQKKHRFKKGTTTFTLHPGPHKIEVQVNGACLAAATFDLLPAPE
ncbi:DNA alkylation repair protein [Roseovarius sp. EL26]|uniref:DNA alkylation repair protein n=1 Tax=Roseovarius sp. EL26 TaxID=2126672 RepID=UPI0020B15384|nr:DNA alkylation repair protein [Roseovarius sp. EL26]